MTAETSGRRHYKPTAAQREHGSTGMQGAQPDPIVAHNRDQLRWNHFHEVHLDTNGLRDDWDETIRASRAARKAWDGAGRPLGDEAPLLWAAMDKASHHLAYLSGGHGTPWPLPSFAHRHCSFPAHPCDGDTA